MTIMCKKFAKQKTLKIFANNKHLKNNKIKTKVYIGLKKFKLQLQKNSIDLNQHVQEACNYLTLHMNLRKVIK